MTPTEGWPYGRVLKTYSGHGRVTGSSGDIACAFEIVQLSTGKLVARCEADSGLSFRWFGTVVALQGKTGAAQTVEVEHCLVTGEQPRWDAAARAMTLCLACRAATVRSSEGRIVSLRYAVTNIDDRPGSQLTLDGYDVAIRPLEAARKILCGIRAEQGIAVTATATVVAGLAQVEAVDQVMNQLCLLLSLAQGHGLAWVYREALDGEGRVIEALHGDAVTKPWGGQELVPREATKDFLLATHPRFREANERWDLTRAINAFTDAKIETPFLEARALQMVIVMEHICSRYLRATGGEFIILESQFEQGRRGLDTRMRPVLQSVFGGASEMQINKLLGNVKALNRPTFRGTLRALCKELGVTLSEEERSRFIAIRNALVHTLTFLPHLEPWKEQYCLLGTVVGKVLLATLGWQGEYRDWSKDPNIPERLAGSSLSK